MWPRPGESPALSVSRLSARMSLVADLRDTRRTGEERRGGRPRDPGNTTDRFMAARRFDAVFIDFYGTICAGDREAVEAVCQRVVDSCDLPLSAPRLAVIWGECFFDMLDRCRGESFRTLYECELASLQQTLEAFGKSPDPLPFVARIEEYWVNAPIYPDAMDFLRRNDLPVVCVSNADTKPLTAAIGKHGLRFDAVVTSEDSRSYKPDSGIFEQALDVLGVDPGRTIHVGDSLHADIGGASKLGISTAWVHRENRIHDIGTGSADFTIRSLAELPAILSDNQPAIAEPKQGFSSG